MRIAILSDIHDNLWNLAAAIHHVQDAGILICCGDLCSPFVMDELAGFPGEVHIVFGNNDADLYRITMKASKNPRIHLHGELLQTNFEGKRFAVNHFDYLARPISKSGDYDVVCFGHNHEFEVSHECSCLLINPGPIMGAKFSSGHWEDTAPTFVTYDTRTNAPEAWAIDPSTKVVLKRLPSAAANQP
ncbi:MAG TPA: metallophosphoesterase family protein [Bryobacteraceae bacterium]|nr:metallophosphoesterase family protein [Bryobacteraceae bacterium]